MDESDDRLVLYLPPSRTLGGVGCLAGAFLVFTGLVVVILTIEAIRGKLAFQWNAKAILAAPKLVLFWLGGLIFTSLALRSWFERTLLLVTADQVVLQRILFGRKSKRSIAVDGSTRAELQEAQGFKDLAVYRVIVTGTHGELHFGVGLNHWEKEWLVDRINRQLAVGSFGRTEGQTGPVTPRRISRGRNSLVSPLRPDQLPTGSLVTIREDTPDRLVVSCRAAPGLLARFLLPLFLSLPALIFVGFALVLCLAVLTQPFGERTLVALLAALAALGVGLPPLLGSLYLCLGRNTVELTRERLRCRWHLGPLGVGRSISTSELDAITFDYGVAAPRNPNQPRPEPIPLGWSGRTAVARGGGRRLPLTLLQPADVSRQVAGLLIGRLQDWGLLPTGNSRGYSGPSL